MKLTDDITVLKGIGEKTAGLFNRVGVSSVRDLVNYLPTDYIEYPKIRKTDEVVSGSKFALALTIGTDPVVTRLKGFTVLNCRAFDSAGEIVIRWFNMPYLKKSLKKGMCAVFYGNAVKQ